MCSAVHFNVFVFWHGSEGDGRSRGTSGGRGTREGLLKVSGFNEPTAVFSVRKEFRVLANGDDSIDAHYPK